MSIDLPQPNERYEDLKRQIPNFNVVNEINEGEVWMGVAERGLPSAALCIDTNTKMIYIGKSHDETQASHSIPDSDYISGIIYFSNYPADFSVNYLQDWRKKLEIYDDDLEQIIVDKLKTVLK